MIRERKEYQREPWASKGVDCESPTLVGEENETLFTRGMKTFLRGSKRVDCESSTLVGALHKAQKRPYLLAVNLDPQDKL